MTHALSPTSIAPTRETYEELQVAYDHFNIQLFEAQLPSCLITLQREKRTFGYFSPARFASLTGQTTDEIALNPTYFAVVPIVETLQTLAHEMVHLWQEHHGKPGRGRYHNDEWANKMERIGLMPSSTGQPGGKRTGDMMADYAITGGRFLSACEALLTGSFKLSWYDRFPSEEHVRIGAQSQATRIEGIQGTTVPMSSNQALASAIRPGGNVRNPEGSQNPETASGQPQASNKSNRIKYTCSGCKNISVWGKPSISLICGECKSAFIAS